MPQLSSKSTSHKTGMNFMKFDRLAQQRRASYEPVNSICSFANSSCLDLSKRLSNLESFHPGNEFKTNAIAASFP